MRPHGLSRIFADRLARIERYGTISQLVFGALKRAAAKGPTICLVNCRVIVATVLLGKNAGARLVSAPHDRPEDRQARGTVAGHPDRRRIVLTTQTSSDLPQNDRGLAPLLPLTYP